MYQRGALQSMVGALAAKIVMSEAPKFLVHERH
jgi:hypothetical protein